MRDGMGDIGGMMWGMGISHLLVVAVVLLVIAALIKYVFSDERDRSYSNLDER